MNKKEKRADKLRRCRRTAAYRLEKLMVKQIRHVSTILLVVLQAFADKVLSDWADFRISRKVDLGCVQNCFFLEDLLLCSFMTKRSSPV